MKGSGYAHMGVGRAAGKEKALEAARMAIQSPLLETSIKGSKGVLINIIGSPELELCEVDTAADLVRENADPEAQIIFGAAIDEKLVDEMRITIIATGFEDDSPNLLNLPEQTETAVINKDNKTKKENNDGLKVDFPFKKTAQKKDEFKSSISSEYDRLIEMLTRQ
jgi:cell division protein FtsZ